MTRVLQVLCLTLCLRTMFAGGVAVVAQTAEASNSQAPDDHAKAQRVPTDSTAQVTLGQSAVPLYGPWKFMVGDSPTDPETGQPRWAEPSFDDSQWETVDLAPKDGAVSPIGGFSGYVPGWTARGHADYSGYAWYRIRVHCQGGSKSSLALAGPANIDDAYQAFDEGKLLGSFGDFSRKPPLIYYTQPLQFRLPETCTPSAAAQVLAFRFWMEPSTLLTDPDAGGMKSAPLLGEAGVIGLFYQSQRLELIRGYLMYAIEAVVFALLAVVAFSLILFDRSDRVYLWIGLLFLVTSATNWFGASASWTQWISIPLSLVVDGSLGAVTFALWVIVWWVWFGREGFRWLPAVLSGLVVLSAVSRILGLEIFPGLVSHPIALQLYALNQGLRFVFFGLLVWVVLDGIRRKGMDGWLALPVVLLHGIATFSSDLIRLHLFHDWFPLGVEVTPGDVAIFLVAAVIALLLLRRLLESVKRQREIALDVKQAQEVQQVILPERRIALPGFAIETEYRPALEVGGDFYQIVPHPSNGSLLIVAGDVAGHGLKAGMLVALLVGAIRSTTDWTIDPVIVLRALNQRLMGRGDAQATCLALRIDANGQVTLANAGHVPPYLNCEELHLEGALPLGMFEGAEPSVMRFQLQPEDRLILMSDGVAEAMDANGQLYGFERVHELLRTARSAAQVADAAQAFGQQDDISVVSVTRIAALKSTTA
ncbi:MAG TPA: PP2C family protein-serine/threonine phosphatase [Terracidiphilus sp.]|jgi:hypothetical protein|nr:PP2C family protein-serine/threonine phosphatase [Terracidiphilus sp.]